MRVYDDGDKTLFFFLISQQTSKVEQSGEKKVSRKQIDKIELWGMSFARMGNLNSRVFFRIAIHIIYYFTTVLIHKTRGVSKVSV